MKNKSLIIALITVFAIAISGSLFAQDDTKQDNSKQEVKTYKMTPEQQATKMADKMKKKFDLNTDQYGKIKTLFADNIAYKRDLMTKDLISRSEMKQKREELQNGIKSTLNADQKKKYEKMLAKKHKKHHHEEHF